MTNAVMVQPRYKLVETIAELSDLLTQVVQSGAIWAFDIETGYNGEDHEGYSLHPETAFVVGFSFCWNEESAYYVPLAHDLGAEYNLDSEQAAILLWQALQFGMGVPHNAKFELRQLSSFFRQYLSTHPILGEQVRNRNGYYPISGDTFLMAYCIAAHQQFGLKFLTRTLYGHKMAELLDLFEPEYTKTGKEKKPTKKKQNSIRFNKLELTKKNIEYACEDAYWTRRLFFDLPYLMLSSQDNVNLRVLNFKNIYKLELETLPSVCAMEDFGIAVDWGMIAKAAYDGGKFRDRLNQEIQEELSALLGRDVNINLTSPPQMQKLLFEDLGLRTNRYTKSTKNLPPDQRKMSTDGQVLSTLSQQVPTLKKVIQWREMKTLLTRYLVNYERDYSYAEDGHIHPDLFSAGTITGRFSAAHPNYQQLPKRYYFKLASARVVDVEHERAHGGRFDADDRRGIEDKCADPKSVAKWGVCGEFPYPAGSVFDFNFRNAIIAPSGWKIFGFDYSQAELRAIAGEANEPAMLDAFHNGIDVHKKTAALMLRKSVEQVTKQERDRWGKMLNFALCYGLSPESLGEKLGFNRVKQPGETESEAMREGKELFNTYYGIYPNIKKWQDEQIKKVKQGFVYSRFGRRIPLWDLLSNQRWIRSKADRVAVNGPIQGGATGDNVKRAMAEIHEALYNSEFRDTVKMVMNIHDALEFYVRNDVDINEVYHLLEPIIVKEIDGWAPLVAEWHIGERWGQVEDLIDVGDGRLILKDGKSEKDEKVDLVPAVEEEDQLPAPPEEEEDPLVIFPPEARTIVVLVKEMPTRQRYSDFINLLQEKDGVNKVKFIAPGVTVESGQAKIPVCTGLTPLDQQQVSMVLNGARVYYASDEVDAKDFLKSIGI